MEGTAGFDYLEEALAAFTRAHAVVLAGRVVATHCAQQTLLHLPLPRGWGPVRARRRGGGRGLQLVLLQF